MDAKNALILNNIEFFFKELANCQDSYKRRELIRDAIQVAKYRKDILMLQQLASIDTADWDFETPLSEIFAALVQLDAHESAITLAFQLNDEILPTATSWFYLATAFLNDNKLDLAHKAYLNLRDRHHQETIATHALQKLQEPVQWELWLKWFDRYAQVVQTRHPLENTVRTIISTLAQQPDFLTVFSKLHALANTKGKDYLLYKLYMHLFLNEQSEKAQALLPFFPETLHWLMIINSQFDPEKILEVITKLEAEDLKIILPRVIIKLITKYLVQNDKDLKAIILKTTENIKDHSSTILEITCNLLLAENRLDLVIELYPNFSYTSKDQILKILSTKHLSSKQYAAILQNFSDFEFNKENNEYFPCATKLFLASVPQPELAFEIQRRTEEALKEIESLLSIPPGRISRYQPEFSVITSLIDKLLNFGKIRPALNLCNILVKSKARHSYAVDIFKVALQFQQYEEAKAAISLFFEKSLQTSLRSFLLLYKKGNFRRALKCLIPLGRQFIHLIHKCVDLILAEDNKSQAMQFLIDVGVADIYEYPDKDMDSKSPTPTIKRKIVYVWLREYSQPKQIRILIQKLSKPPFECLSHEFFSEFLSNRQFSIAIEILNQSIKSKKYIWDKEINSSFMETINDFLEKFYPTREFILAIHLLKSEAAQSELFDKISEKLTSSDNETDITLIKLYPAIEQRENYLLKATIEAIKINDFPLARYAISGLPENSRRLWETIISHIHQKNYAAALNLTMELEKVAQWHQENFLEWLFPFWLRTQSPVKLFQYLTKLKKELDKNDPAKPISITDPHYGDYRLTIFIFKTVYSYWGELLSAAEDCDILFTGLNQLKFDGSSTLAFEVHHLTPLKIMFYELFKNKKFLEANRVVSEYYKHEPKGHFELYDYLKELLNAQQFSTTRQLIEIVAPYNFSWAKQATMELCAKYLEVGLPTEVENILLDVKQDDNSCQQFSQLFLRLLEISLTENTWDLLQKFKRTIYNPAEVITRILKHHNEISNILAVNYLENATTTPSEKVRLMTMLSEHYLQHLENLIGTDRLQALLFVYKKLRHFLSLLAKGQDIEAGQLKNDILVPLRHELDKAFIAFYRQHYGEPPIDSRNGKRITVYFPVVPELRGYSIEHQLAYYTTRFLKLPNLENDHPELFNYLAAIQPLNAPDGYLWLRQLYDLSNTEKHDHSLPLTPQHQGKDIEMRVFLPLILDGVTEIILKLACPNKSRKRLASLNFSRYVNSITHQRLQLTLFFSGTTKSLPAAPAAPAAPAPSITSRATI
jgi:hypothetical protein